MTALSKVKKLVRPQRIVKLPPDAFEANWHGRPNVDVAVGLRLLSVKELAECRLEAEREATGVYDNHPPGANPMSDVVVEQYNEILLCEAMARATCDPNNVTVPYFEQANITIRAALTSEALQRLWDEYQILSNGIGYVLPQASDEEMKLLGRVLRSEIGRRTLDTEGRKLCLYLLAKLKDALPETPDEEMDEMLDGAIDAFEGEDEVESVHVARAG